MFSFVSFAFLVGLLLLQSILIVFYLMHNCLSESVLLLKDVVVAVWSHWMVVIPM